MTCERHCEGCARERRIEWALAEERRLKALPVKVEEQRKFAWRPLRCPATKRRHWLRRVTLRYESQVVYDVWLRWYGRVMTLVSVTAEDKEA